MSDAIPAAAEFLRLQDELSSARHTLATGIEMLHAFIGEIDDRSPVISRINFVLEALDSPILGIQEVRDGIDALRKAVDGVTP